MQDWWEDLYQILLIILQKEFTKLNELKDCDRFVEYGSIKENLIKYKFLSCCKEYLTKIDKELKKRLNNTFKFSNNDINKFILLLIKDVYPYEYTDE